MDLEVVDSVLVSEPVVVEIPTISVESTGEEIELGVTRKEFNIVGDSIYIGNRLEDTPQWLVSYLDTLAGLALDSKISTINGLSQSLEDLIADLNVAKNAYTSAVITYEELELMVNAKIDTLNSTLSGSDATIIDLISTKVTATEAQAVATNVLSASINGGAIGALVGSVQEALATESAARAYDATTLTAQLEGFDNTYSTALTGLEADVSSQGDIITGHSGEFTKLNTAITSGNFSTYGASNFYNTLDTKINNTIVTVGSNFAYDSTLVIGPYAYNSGFGIKSTGTTGTNVTVNGTSYPLWSSEFWVKADKFKMVAASQTAAAQSPFTVNATTGDITFNGKVSFSSVTGAPYGGSNLLYNSAPMLANEMKGWSIGWYNTGIVPALGAGFEPWRPSGGGSVYAVVPGAPTIGGLFDLAQTAKVPVIGDKWYEASAYISSHRCTSYVTIAWYDSNNAYIGEAGGTNVSGASSGALANWSRSTLLAQAPANAARAHFYVRSAVSGTDPYCFVAFAYLGQAVQGQTVFSDWSEGTSAGVSSGEVVNDINNGNTTTINGGRITTGSVTANQIAANSIMANMINADAINGKVIKGSIIEGASITGSVIKSSWIDYSSTGHLTNWKYFTNATVPEAYRGNFAFDNYGNIIIDSEGYVRLQGTTELYSATKSANQYKGGTLTLVGSDEVYPYDSYTINTARRCISIRPRLVTTSDLMIGAFPSGGNMSFTLGNYTISIYTGVGNSINVYVNGVLITTAEMWSWTLPYGIEMGAASLSTSIGAIFRWNIYLKTQSTLFTEDFTGSSPFLLNLTANAPISGEYITISLAIPQYALN